MPGTRQDPCTLLKDDRPDWEAIDFDVYCGRCGYDLRLLPEPRCPECGLRFEWPAVLDEAFWRSDFLFEHHWRRRPLRSWAKTVWRSLRPGRFWRAVSIHEKIHVGPLCLLMFCSVATFLLALHGTACLGALVAEVVDRSQPRPGPWSSSYAGQLADELWLLAKVPLRGNHVYYNSAGLLMATHLVALALLCSLHQTLGRCRVRRLQIFRVVAYMATPVSILWGLSIVVVAFLALLSFVFSASALQVAWACLGWIMPPVILAGFLRAGLKHYLQFPRSSFVAITAAGVAFLFAVTVFFALRCY